MERSLLGREIDPKIRRKRSAQGEGNGDANAYRPLIAITREVICGGGRKRGVDESLLPVAFLIVSDGNGRRICAIVNINIAAEEEVDQTSPWQRQKNALGLYTRFLRTSSRGIETYHSDFPATRRVGG